MNNSRDDKRVSTLTGCQTFNMTAADPDIPETLNNRKTSRQIFAYKPYNGILLQSRLYNTNGGTCGNHAESELYRDLIQRELSELEGVANLRQKEKYCGNKHGVYFRKGYGFGGYADCFHADFNAKISIRADHANDFESFNVGTYGLCICCAEKTSSGLYCSDCDSDEHEFCQECEQSCYETCDVINRHGERIHVCEHCLNEYYRFCDHCEEYHPQSEFTTVGDVNRVCLTCLKNDYALCSECNEYFLADGLSPQVNAYGKTVYLCESCRYQKETSA